MLVIVATSFFNAKTEKLYIQNSALNVNTLKPSLFFFLSSDFLLFLYLEQRICSMPMSVSLARLNFYGIVLTLNGELGTKLRIMCESSPPDLLLARSRAAAIQLNYRWGNPIFANFFPSSSSLLSPPQICNVIPGFRGFPVSVSFLDLSDSFLEFEIQSSFFFLKLALFLIGAVRKFFSGELRFNSLDVSCAKGRVGLGYQKYIQLMKITSRLAK